MWSVRPFSARWAAAPKERAAEAVAARLDATAGRCPTILGVELERFCGRLAAVVARIAGVTDRATRPLWTGSRYEGCPNEEKRGPALAKFGAPPDMRAPPKPTPPPRLPAPKLPCGALNPPPPRKPPPPCPAAHVAGTKAIDMMPTKPNNPNLFMLQGRYSSVSQPWCICGILQSYLRVGRLSLFRVKGRYPPVRKIGFKHGDRAPSL